MNTAILEEIDLLLLFNQQTAQQGIKVHSSASDSSKAAAVRLFDKGLISQSDGGYLTDRGIEAAKHGENLVSLLTQSTVLS